MTNLEKKLFGLTNEKDDLQKNFQKMTKERGELMDYIEEITGKSTKTEKQLQDDTVELQKKLVKAQEDMNSASSELEMMVNFLNALILD
jgi:predicted  nucleic acid-binding Zn-ribbon protein